MLKKSKFTLALVALAAVSMLTGCLGDSNRSSDSFVATKTVYKYNTGEISSNKWVNEILFIIPGGLCYGIAGFLDVIIFNSIQFWSGSNPIAGTTVTDVNGTEYRVAQIDNTIEITNLSTHEVAAFEVAQDGSYKAL